MAANRCDTRRAAAFVVIAGAVILASGCASLNSSVPFQYQPSLVSSGKQIPKAVGFNLLTDNRPEKDREYTKSIKDVPEKVTSKLIEDFEHSKIFQDVHYPPRENDDIVVTGNINRFKWKLYTRGIAYVPYLGLAAGIFGVPLTRAYGLADIQLELRDKATGRILCSTSGSSEVETLYTMYNLKTGEAGAELAESLRDVGKKLKQDVILQLGTK